MQRNKIFFLTCIACLLFWCSNVGAQNKYKIELSVRDSVTGLPLSNALVNIPKIDTVAEANRKGHLSLNLQQGNYEFIANYSGSKSKYLQINLQKDTVITVFLSSGVKHYFISEVEVTGHFDKSENVYSGLEKLRPSAIKSLPSVFGEKDVVKTLGTLPGVASGSEGSADIYVRGGTTDQNLFLIDGNTIYHPSHLFGFFSAIEPEIIEEVDFYKGSFPVNYSGKLSSVIDIKTKNPLLDSFNVKAEIGTLSGKVTCTIPVKDKTGILLSARATHFDQLMKLYYAASDEYQVAGFYELFGKVNHKINDKSNISADLYFDRDYFWQGDGGERSSDNNIKWKNRFFTANYNYQLSKNSIFTATAGWTKYKMQINESYLNTDSTQNYAKDFDSYIEDMYLKTMFKKQSGNQLNLLAGVDYIFHDILPATVHGVYYDTTYTQTIISSSTFHEIGAYASNVFKPFQNLKIQAGVRFSCLLNSSEHWYSFDPRINVQYRFSNNNSLKFSCTKVSQPIHLLTNPGLGIPIDIHIPFTNDYRPEYAHQFSIAANLKKKIHDKMYYLTLEGYYKKMENIVSYLPGTSSRNFTSVVSIQKTIDEIITTGKGKSYGLEFLLEKPFGKVNGRIAYTLSAIKHQFDELNDGKEFYAQYHRPHNLDVALSYKINKKHSVSTNFKYMSGARVTLPVCLYSGYSFGIAGNKTYMHISGLLYKQSEINAYKMMDFNTLSFSYLYKFKKKKWNGECEFSLYNVYNRKNPYYYYLDYKSVRVVDEEGTTYTYKQPYLVSVSMFGIIPSFTFRVNF